MVSKEIDDLCDRFESAIRAGENQQIAEYLSEVDSNSQGELFRELAGLEMELLPSSQWQKKLDEYRTDFPGYADILDELDEFQSSATLVPPSSKGQKHSEDQTAEEQVSGQLHEKIGNYTLLTKIGEGGMGAVFRAQQQEPVKRTVAIKLIRNQHLSREGVQRFEAERQALAMMNHPNIASILDAGATDEGQPFYVMQLVNGNPLTEYCDQYKLSIQERLLLFLDVCEATQHAHQKSILHRDLKPANILVEQKEGKHFPKVIDFGLAKSLETNLKLTDVSMQTEVGQVVGTIRYMSPEQANLEHHDVDTRTDVYALGVILFELLTGSTPIEQDSLQGKSLLQMLQLVREQEPPLPSRRFSSRKEAIAEITANCRTDANSLDLALRGDLDWIVLKALALDREQRYPTVTALADDIRRHLHHEPVLARPASNLYFAKKYIRKHRALVSSLATIALLLVVGICATSWFAWSAAVAKQRAESLAKAEQTARELADQQTRKARIQAANVLMQQAFIARDQEGDTLKSSALFAEAGSLFALSGDSAAAESAMMATTPEQPFTVRHRREVTAANWLPSRKMILTASTDTTAKLWQASDGSLVSTLPHHSPVLGAYLSNDESRVLTLTETGVHLWDVGDEQPTQVQRIAANRPTTAVFNEAGDHILVCNWEGTATLWKVGEKEPLHKLPHEEFNAKATFSPNETYVLISGDNHEGGAVTVFDASHGKQVARFEGVKNASFSHDDSEVALATKQGTAQIVELPSGKTLHECEIVERSSRKPASVYDVRYLKERARLITMANDSLMRVWRLNTTPELLFELGTQNKSNNQGVIAFNDNSTRVVCVFENEIEVWDVDSGKRLRVWQTTKSPTAKPIVGIKFLPNDHLTSNQVISWDAQGNTRRWDFAKDQPVAVYINESIRQHDEAKLSPSVPAPIVHPQEKRILTLGRNGIARVWPLDPGTPNWAHKRGGDDLARVAQFSNSAATVITLNADGSQRVVPFGGLRTQDDNTGAFTSTQTVVAHDPKSKGFRATERVAHATTRQTEELQQTPRQLLRALQNQSYKKPQNPLREVVGATSYLQWSDDYVGIAWWRSAKNNEPIRTLRDFEKIEGVYFGKDSKCLLLTAGNQATLWQQDAAIPPFKVTQPNGNDILGAKLISPDGEFLTWNRSVWHWQPHSTKPSCEFEHDDDVVHAEISDDQLVLLTCCRDGVIRLFDLKTGTLLQSLVHGDLLTSAVFNQDRTKVVSWGTGGGIHIWQADTGKLLRHWEHSHEIRIARFVANDRRVLATSTDNLMHLWDVNYQYPLRWFQHGGLITHVVMNDAGSRILTGCADRIDRVWEIPTIQQTTAEEFRQQIQYRTATLVDPIAGQVRLMTEPEFKHRQKTP